MQSAIEDKPSSETSESDEEEEFVVQDILAERESDDGVMLYLVKWENYGDESCTWEPSESFFNPETLIDWAKKRDAGAQLDNDTVTRIVTNLNPYLPSAGTNAVQSADRVRKDSNAGEILKLPNTAIAKVTVKGKHARSGSRVALAQSKNAAAEVSHPPNAPASFVEQERTSKAREITATAAGKEKPLFHGFSIRKNHMTGHHARRGGLTRGTSSGRFRNLKHMNNVRKVLHKEREPDPKRIKLLSMAAWAEQEPEDTNQTLPPLLISRLPPPRAQGPEPRDMDLPPTVIGHGVPQQRAADSNVTMDPPDDLRPVRGQINTAAAPSYLSQPASSVAITRSSTLPDMRNHDRKDIYANQMRTERTLVRGRTINFPGELLAEFKFGKIDIGDVIVKGLLPWAFGHMRLAQGPDQKKTVIEIQRKDVVTRSQWTTLCSGRSSALQPTGKVIPYEDTRGIVQEMGTYLHQQNLAALWYHPSKDMMLVFYSPSSDDWLFLEREGGLPFDSNIRVLTRNKIASTEILDQGVESMTLDALPPTTETQYQNQPITAPMSDLSNTAAHSDIHESHMPQLFEHGKALLTHTQLLRLSEADLVTAFERQFGISYDHLTAIPYSTSRGDDPGPAKARFFLGFPQAAQEEMACLQRFLRANTSQVKIWTSLDDGGWEAFKTLCHHDWIAVVLLHRDSLMIESLVGLTRILRSSNLNVFQVSLNSPCPDQGGLLDGEGCHIQRLLPHGKAIVLTEGVLSDHGIPILGWFARQTKHGRGTKLILPPDIRNRLINKIKDHPSTVERLTKTLVAINRLKPEISAEQPLSLLDSTSPSDDESIKSMYTEKIRWQDTLFSPSKIVGYDLPQPAPDSEYEEKHKEAVLIEYFAGWAYTHAAFHRRFVAVTRFAGEVDKKWGHIEVQSPEKFMEVEKIV